MNLFISYNQWIVVVIGVLLCILIVLLRRDLAIGVAICYVVFIIFQTLVRHSETGNLDLELFWSYKQFFTNHSLRVQILNNIWLFIPFGAALYSILRKPQYLIIPFLLSVTIEVSQYFFHIGLCELDDIFSNTLGGCVGYLMAYEIEAIISGVRTKYAKRV